jgi:hypothetical protein
MTRMVTRLLLIVTTRLAGAALAAGSAAAVPLHEGDPAPDIDLPATQVGRALPDHAGDRTLHLKDLQNKKIVVLYFFPKALTGG